MTRMTDLTRKLGRLQLAGPFEELPLDDRQLAKLKRAGAEIAAYIAYDGKHAVSTTLGVDRRSCTAHVFVPMTVAPFEVSPDEMDRYLAAGQLAARIPGSAIAIDRDARVNVAFAQTFDNPDANHVVNFIQSAAAAGINAQPTLSRELTRLGFQTDLSRDKLLAKAAGRPVRLSLREMEALGTEGRRVVQC